LSFEQTNNYTNIKASPYDSNLYFLRYVTFLHFVHSNGREAEISEDIITEIYLL